MKQLLAAVIGAIVFAHAAPVRGDILSLIRQGKIDEALDSISALSSTFSERGNILFYRALIEPNADSSVALFAAALENKVNSQFEEVIAARLAYYYLTVGEMDKAVQKAEEYRTRWANGEEAAAMARIVTLAHEQQGDQVAALQMVEQSAKEHSQDEYSQWSLIDRARLMGAGDKTAGLTKMLKKLSLDKSGLGASIALQLLVKNSLANQQFGDAVQYFAALKEQYPHAVGQAALADQMADIPEEDIKDAQAEKLTGTYYAVKVGVFSEKGNADKQVERCRQPGQPFTIDSKVIGGKNYFIVYVGRYRSFAEAEELKTRLESQFSESYQVTAR